MFNDIKFLLGILVCFSLFKTNNAQQYRSLDGTNNNLNVPNAGAVGAVYLNYKNAIELFADSTTASMLSCPHNYQAVTLPVVDKCVDILPEGTFPLPRCLSDLGDGVQATRAQQFNETFVNNHKSKRKSSHMMTFWADFITFDITFSQETEILNDAILIPSDDVTYLSEGSTQISQTTLPFSRSYNISSRGTVNLASAYVDGSNIYGVDETRLNEILRDPNNRCKMRLTYGESGDSALGYLPKDANGNYIHGQETIRGSNIFVDMIITVFLREHNRRCDNLTSIYGDKWDDETYFQEARKWTIALIQKINYLEYLSILMGSPLLEFTQYDPSLTAGIDFIFITSTMRYGHSETSDNFNIMNQNGEIITSIPLNQVKTQVEVFGVPTIATSIALQRQEEIDIFYSDYARNLQTTPNGPIIDLASIDHLRVRDRGVPSYNDVRELYGFPRATDFSDITANVEIQGRLKSLYSSIDKVEAYIGGLAEDHYNNSNFGPLFQKSMQEQWQLIRDADRFWFESPDAGFTKQEIEEIRNTTFRDVILRNSPNDTKLPDNIWFVQPRNDLSSINSNANNDVDADGYLKENTFQISQIYNIKWKIIDSDIYFKMRLESDNAWFGLGFNPEDDGMRGADFLIVNSQGNDIQVGNYRSNGYQPPIIAARQFVEKISGNISSGFMEVQVKRPLNAPERVPIKNDTTSLIFAWNPNSNALSYHGGNRGKAKINFFQSGISTSSSSNRLALLAHGIWMFATWSIIFPISIIIVRYMKHKVHHLNQHKNLQIIGGVGVATFGTSALAVAQEQSRTPHKFVGILIYTGIFLQLGLGLLSLWARSSLVSSNHGIFKSIKVAHFLLGAALMLSAAFNIYLGIDAYGQSEMWKLVYFGWVGLLCVIIIGLEIWHIYNRKKNLIDSDTNVLEGGVKGRIRKHLDNIDKNLVDDLPDVTWNEVYQRVIQGAKLVVAEDLLFDIRRWINVHPGGSQVLKHVIGTDITNDFFKDLQPNKNEQNPLILQKSKRNEGRIERPQLSDSSGIINYLERLNRKYIGNNPGHHHSRFATATLASMVIGKMINSENSRNDDEFKRYILVAVKSVTVGNPVCPVKRFIFRDPSERKLPEFKPGDYFEVFSYTQGQSVVRPYTILKVDDEKYKNMNCFSIIVKIYKYGAMSRHLGRLLEGFTVKMRGPISINGHIGQLQRPSMRRALSMISVYSEPEDKSSLLNPDSNDGCWDILFMICGGTGITPMIQLIEYHIEKGKRKNIKLFLLFANNSESDIILYPNGLNELMSRSDGKLHISFALSHPPSGWSHYQRLNYDVIFDWMSKNYIPNDNDNITIIQSSIMNGQTSFSSTLNTGISSTKQPEQQNQSIYEPTKYMEALKNDPVALKVMVCGPLPMILSVSNVLNKLNFPEDKVIIIN